MRQLFIILTVLFVSLLAQTQTLIQQIDDSLQSIPYIIEGEIESVEIYCSDANGNRLPFDSLTWSDNIGTWKLPDGNDAIGYSKAKIRICKVYKGGFVPNGNPLEVITYSDVLYPYVEAHGSDTVIGYHFFKPTHGFGKQVFLPNSVGSKQIFFIEQNSKPVGTLSLSDIGSIEYHLDFDEDSGHSLDNEACTVGEGVFSHIGNTYSQDQINDFLNQFSAIDTSVINYCESENSESKI